MHRKKKRDLEPHDWAVETHRMAKIVWEKAQAKTVLDGAYLDDAIKNMIDRQLGSPACAWRGS